MKLIVESKTKNYKWEAQIARKEMNDPLSGQQIMYWTLYPFPKQVVLVQPKDEEDDQEVARELTKHIQKLLAQESSLLWEVRVEK